MTKLTTEVNVDDLTKLQKILISESNLENLKGY
jgi:hypothetical protein